MNSAECNDGEKNSGYSFDLGTYIRGNKLQYVLTYSLEAKLSKRSTRVFTYWNRKSCLQSTPIHGDRQHYVLLSRICAGEQSEHTPPCARSRRPKYLDEYYAMSLWMLHWLTSPPKATKERIYSDVVYLNFVAHQHRILTTSYGNREEDSDTVRLLISWIPQRYIVQGP